MKETKWSQNLFSSEILNIGRLSDKATSRYNSPKSNRILLNESVHVKLAEFQPNSIDQKSSTKPNWVVWKRTERSKPCYLPSSLLYTNLENLVFESPRVQCVSKTARDLEPREKVNTFLPFISWFIIQSYSIILLTQIILTFMLNFPGSGPAFLL